MTSHYIDLAYAGMARGKPYSLNGDQQPNAPQQLELSPKFISIENAVVDHLARVIRPNEKPRLLLWGPGMSRTDPHYALRFLDRLTGTGGDLTVSDTQDSDLLRDYYQQLRSRGHDISLQLGLEWQSPPVPNVHLLISFHPAQIHTILEDAAKSLVPGGLVLFQHDLPIFLPDEEETDILLEVISTLYGEVFENLHEPIKQELVRTPFSRRASQFLFMTLVRK